MGRREVTGGLLGNRRKRRGPLSSSIPTEPWHVLTFLIPGWTPPKPPKRGRGRPPRKGFAKIVRDPDIDKLTIDHPEYGKIRVVDLLEWDGRYGVRPGNLIEEDDIVTVATAKRQNARLRAAARKRKKGILSPPK
jgi:hypothetical protein